MVILPILGPRQILGNLILDLENFFTDIHKYLRFLEEIFIKILADYGLKEKRSIVKQVRLLR
ncbi:octanoate-[acyl-carrier-protein]-protein-N-octan oyltransferase [Nonlabens ulvanivorans]|uniref:Octanoate-[acyl-carrier-protein]-protein-N-octan oyltransferase n=1 Tax=Nonlabens ulvanivorans TaxID=906888 RepID=A0A090QUZ6_NONUL|nr:octanoate-[acyl-carrier-protein]-protein-N-octan oyltransferase [Nonlabens ulvanivorans]